MNKCVVLISLLLMAVLAMGQSSLPQPKVTYRYGDNAPVVLPGEAIEVVYVVKGAHVVEFSLLDSLMGEFWYDEDLGDSLVTISGTVASDTDPGEYLQQILAKDTVHGTSVNSMFYIKVLSKEEAFVHSSGSLKQTVTAGDAIEPIVFDYLKLHDFRIDNLPSGLTAKNENNTIVIEGIAEASHKDENYTFTLVADLTETISVTYDIKLDVEHIPVVTMIKVLENDSQAVVAGESIKPITLKYENITDLHFKDIPKTIDVFDDPETKTILLQGSIPEDFGDSMFVMVVCAKGYDNNDTAYVKLNIKRNPNAQVNDPMSSSSSSVDDSSSSEQEEAFAYAQKVKAAHWSLESNVLNVTISEPVSVQIIDMVGNCLMVLQVNASTSFDLGYMQRGAYLMRLVGNGFAETARITVK